MPNPPASGRPPVGGLITTRIGDELLAAVAEQAEQARVDRSAMLRALLAQALFDADAIDADTADRYTLGGAPARYGTSRRAARYRRD